MECQLRNPGFRDGFDDVPPPGSLAAMLILVKSAIPDTWT
jgi:hypothetical protein